MNSYRYISSSILALIGFFPNHVYANDYKYSIAFLCTSTPIVAHGDLNTFTSVDIINPLDQAVEIEFNGRVKMTLEPASLKQLDCPQFDTLNISADDSAPLLISTDALIDVQVKYLTKLGDSIGYDVEKITPYGLFSKEPPSDNDPGRDTSDNMDWNKCDEFDEVTTPSFFSSPKKFNNNLSPFIVGGVDVEDDKLFPWAVSLVTRYEVFGKLEPADTQSTYYWVDSYCGGTIVDENWIVSAAHCVSVSDIKEKYKTENVDIYEITVGYGSTKLNGQTKVKTKSALCHSKYTGESSVDNYDLSLIKLDQPLPISQTVAAAKLPNQNNDNLDLGDPSKSYLAPIGWGETEETGRSNQLKITGLIADELGEKYIRAVSARDGRVQGVCGGDSGGPVHSLEISTTKFEVVGVTSWIEYPEDDGTCYSLDNKGTFVRLSGFSDSITSKIRNCESQSCF